MARKYRRVAELGRGGMAVVYLAAMHAAHGVTKLVVVKELHTELAIDPEFRAMFVDEARLATRLNHPNVVQTYDVIEATDGACSIVMEYLEGQPMSRLRRWLANSDERLPMHLAMIDGVLAGLEYAHALSDYDSRPLSLVHRDISPHNVFVTYSGEVKIVDFGIAKASANVTETRLGMIKGKIAYMPPEQARGERVDRTADLFAVGVMLWEAVAGQRLWRGLSDVAILHKLTIGEIPSIRDVKENAPEALDRICRRALAVRPEDRYQSAAEMQHDLDAYMRTLPNVPSRREIGAIVSSQFEEERTRLRKEVDERLRQITSDPDMSMQARILPPPASSTSGVLAVGNTGGTATEEPSGTQAGAARSLDAEPASRLRRNLQLFGVTMAVACALFLVVVFAWRGTSKTPEAIGPDSAPPVLVPASTGTTPVAKTVRVTLKISPPLAAMKLDGNPIAAGTTELTDVEGARRSLHVEAPGYEAQDVVLSFAIQSTIEVTLKKPSPAAGAKPTVIAVTPKPTATTPKPRPSSTIDLGY